MPLITPADIESQLLPLPERTAVSQSASRLLQKLVADRTPGDNTWTLCESVWPALALAADGESAHPVSAVGLDLIPLDRVGAPPGQAGPRVLIAYFFDRDKPDLYCSQPLVLKTFEPAGQLDTLQDEAAAARSLRPYTAYYKDAYAVPIHFDPASTACTFSVLWSPLATWGRLTHSREALTGTISVHALIDELRDPARVDAALTHLRTTFDLLLPLHRKCGTARLGEIQLVKEYAWYLRDMDGDTTTATGWQRTWNEPHEKGCADFGRSWTNPFWVVKELARSPRVKGYLGAVHGDIHPRNIVLSQDGGPRIIDFGWGKDDAHIAKDFALMEANLRFMILQPDVGFDHLERMNDSIPFGAPWCSRAATTWMGA